MKNKIMLLFCAVLMIIASTFSMMMPVFADEPGGNNYYCRLCKTDHDVSELSFSQKIAIEWHDVLYSGDWFGEAEKKSTLSTQSVLAFDVTGNFATVWSTAEKFYNFMMPAGIILCVVYALMELMEQITTDRVNPEMVVRTLGKIVIGVIFIQNGFLFCTFTAKVASQVFSTLAGQSGFNNSDLCLFNNIAFLKRSFTTGMLSMSGTYIPWLIVLVTKFIISIMCWTRVLDIMIRIILAPVGMADIMVSGTRGSGWAFFKRLMVSTMQGAVIIAIMYAYSQVLSVINNSATGTGLPAYGLAIICTCVTLFAILKSQSYAQDIIN